MPNQLRKKLFVSLISVILGLVLLVSASFAWLTLSTNPEVSGISVTLNTDRTLLVSLEGTEFTETADLSELFKYYVDLHPVSTIDGINWFIPTYKGDGSLKDINEFILDNNYKYANIYKVKTDSEGNPTETLLEGVALSDAENKGYYVYGDFWVRSEEKTGCKVRLSIPHEPNESAQKHELDDKYGTYVLPNYEYVAGQGAGTGLIDIGSHAQSALRIGFLIMDGVEGNTPMAGEKFIIFEPNADKRSLITADADQVFKKPDQSGDYIVNYQYNSTSYQDGYYIPTLPIGLGTDNIETYVQYDSYTGGQPSITLYVSYNDTYYEVKWNSSESYLYYEISNTAYALTYNTSTKEVKNTEGKTSHLYKKEQIRERVLTPVPASQLVVQVAGEWNLTGENSLESTLQQEGAVPNSLLIKRFGMFLNTSKLNLGLSDQATGQSLFNGLNVSNAYNPSIAGNTLIIDLPNDTPVRIRLFVWIEGQDVDCWNDITSGSFTVNLELAGESK